MSFATFGVGLGVLALGALLSRIKFINTLCLPKAVLGGVCALFIFNFLEYFFGFKASFDESLKEPFLLAFFASLGLGFSFSHSKNLGKKFFIFIGLCATLMLLQNLLGLAVISAFEAPKELGLIAGSVSLSGSFGMGAFFSPVFSSHDLKGALDISIACASFGVLFGSLLGAPLGVFLIKKYALQKSIWNSKNSWNSKISQNSKTEPSQISIWNSKIFWNSKNIFFSVILLGFCVFCALFASKFLGLSSIICALVISLFLKAFLAVFKLKLPGLELNALGSFCLALFLALAFISLDISLLAHLALAIFATLFAQVILMWLFASFVTFRLCGKDYCSALLASAQCGFCLGAAAVALANIRALSLRFGSNEQALNIACVSSVFVIDFINVLIIEFFLCFLGGGILGLSF